MHQDRISLFFPIVRSRKFLKILVSSSLLLTAMPTETLAHLTIVSDLDGTVNNDRGENAGWITPWRLKLIPDRRTPLQPSPREELEGVQFPEYIDVSYAEYLSLRRLWGKEGGAIGDLNPITLPPVPLFRETSIHVIPGYYQIDRPDTYQFYRPATDGTNRLLLGLRDAVKRSKANPKLEWKGMAFPLMQAALSNDANRTFVLSTARDELNVNIAEFFQELKKLDYIQRQVELKDGKLDGVRAHFLSSPDAIRFGHTMSERKVGVAVAEGEQALSTPKAEHLELVPNEEGALRGETRMGHTLIFPEDDVRYATDMVRRLREISSDKDFTQRIKFVFFFAGREEDLGSPALPYRWIVFDKGFMRKALPVEIADWMGVGPSQCAAATLVAAKGRQPRSRASSQKSSKSRGTK